MPSEVGRWYSTSAGCGASVAEPVVVDDGVLVLWNVSCAVCRGSVVVWDGVDEEEDEEEEEC
jgi:hypothetical protein